MGSCISISSSEIHKTKDGSENVVYLQETHYAHEAHGVGSMFSYQGQGSKKCNQDAAILYQGYKTKDGAFYGVFDGHGNNGHDISKMVRNKLPFLLLNQLNVAKKINNTEISDEKIDAQVFTKENFSEWKEACVCAFKVMDKEIKLLEHVDTTSSGATAVVVVKQGQHLIVANLGDSRAILGTKTEHGIIPVPLTTDHKPGLPSETERIRNCNGRVFAMREEPNIPRLWLPDDNSVGIAMSRAFGDFLLKSNGLISIPEVSYHHISPNDKFLVLASDGVWDVLSNNEVAAIVSSATSEATAGRAVVEATKAAWKRRFPDSRRDDSTVICLFFWHKE